MTDPITNRVAQVLTDSRHILVPVDKVFDDLISEGLLSWIPPDIFEKLLDSDMRFELIDGLSDVGLFDPVMQTELEMRGLLSGPMVMLRSRAVSTEVIMVDVLLHLQEMNAALETAWQLRPGNDPEVEAELLNLLMMGDMLERELKHALKMDTLGTEAKIDISRDLSNGEAIN